MVNCRECNGQVSEQAFSCPHCGAPYPAKPQWDGWGFEYKSKTCIAGLPLVHISFKYRPNRAPVVAKGVIAIGQFSLGIINISQFGFGVVCISQFAIAGYALAQFAVAWRLIAQVGLYLSEGRGQAVYNLIELAQKLF